MDLIQKELCAFMDKNAKERVLTKINDISDVVQKSNEDLEIIKGLNCSEMPELQISPQLVVVGLNADKIYQIIKKFTIRPPKLSCSSAAQS